MLCVFAVLLLFFANYERADAAEVGIVGAVQLRLRENPGTDSRIIEELKINSLVSVNSKGYPDAEGNEWFNVTAPDGKTGYVMGRYIVIEPNATYTYDAGFEAMLTAEGFPESYKDSLRDLHAKYPSWVFKAAKTNLNWNDVIAAETKPGRSLIGSSYPDSWKSMEQGCYDFATGKYIVYDSGGWVTAAPDVVRYYMDPRNFLKTSSVFQFLTHSYDPMTQTTEGLKVMLTSTFMDGTYPEEGYNTWADVLMFAGVSTGVNPYVLASMIMQEQGTNGIGACVSGNESGYKGIYNFYNIGAYKTSTMSAATRGLWYASQSGTYGRPWNTRTKAIIGGAQFYAENYVNENKNTLYFKKWNVMNGLSSVGTYQYMSNVMGAYSEGLNLRNGYLTALNTSMTFLIPVYNNMPDAPCPEPAKTGNDNYFLTTLDIDGYELTPAFNMYNTEYELVVGTSVSSVNVKATAYGNGVTVGGTGQHYLVGDNTTLFVTVTSTSGAIKIYTISVSKSAGGQTIAGTPILESEAYNIGAVITGVAPQTDYDSFLANLKPSNGNVIIKNSEGNIVTSGKIGTGYYVVLADSLGAEILQLQVRISGDINCDGKIGTADLLAMQKHIVGAENLSGIAWEAADINADGKISTADLLNLRKHIVGSYEIVQ